MWVGGGSEASTYRVLRVHDHFPRHGAVALGLVRRRLIDGEGVHPEADLARRLGVLLVHVVRLEPLHQLPEGALPPVGDVRARRRRQRRRHQLHVPAAAMKVSPPP
eukprot:1181295-Prorocentrum_minimum.AAC.1